MGLSEATVITQPWGQAQQTTCVGQNRVQYSIVQPGSYVGYPSYNWINPTYPTNNWIWNRLGWANKYPQSSKSSIEKKTKTTSAGPKVANVEPWTDTCRSNVLETCPKPRKKNNEKPFCTFLASLNLAPLSGFNHVYIYIYIGMYVCPSVWSVCMHACMYRNTCSHIYYKV